MQNPWFVYLLALLTGAVGVLSFSPFDYWIAAYFSVAGLLFLTQLSQRRIALRATFLWGMAFFTFGVNWLHVSIHQFGGTPLWLSYVMVLLLAAYLSLYPLLFAYLVQRFQVKSAVIFAVIWTATEWLRGTLFTGFPWLQFGYSQIDSPFAHIAPLFGVSGLTFFVLWGSASILSLVSHLFRTPKNIPLVLFHLGLLIVVAGLAINSGNLKYVHKVEDKSLKVTLAQGNIEQQLKWDPEYFLNTLDIYQKQIQQHLGKSDLIVLPESSLPTLENHLQTFLQSLDDVAGENKTELLIGTVYQDINQNAIFNSIVQLGQQNQKYFAEKAPRYNKVHLVPFGEYVPLEKVLRPLGSVFNLPMSAFQAGNDKQATFQVKGRHLAAAICYEIIFGELVRKNVNKNTDFLLTISNDAWFGNSIGPWQHLQMARMRALELGKPVIRGTNTGITTFIDEFGQIQAQAPQFTQTTLTQVIAPTEGRTPYSALGNLPLYALCILFTLMRGAGWLLRRKMKI
ncbi:apolipoprotein N-acyltransferase [[Haemophilus] felis]|nr:apolipoprotein N-acyltransferase [[Haemophilus] felis]